MPRLLMLLAIAVLFGCRSEPATEERNVRLVKTQEERERRQAELPAARIRQSTPSQSIDSPPAARPTDQSANKSPRFSPTEDTTGNQHVRAKADAHASEHELEAAQREMEKAMMAPINQ